MISSRTGSPFRTLLCLGILAACSLLVHGYHPGAEDDAIYLAAVKKHLDPSLYPFHSGFFTQQTRFTLWDEFTAFCVRLSHLPVQWVILVLYLLSIFGVLAGCLAMSRRCFSEREAHWASVMTIFSLLTLPVAGTALQIADFHLHPRSPATALILMALAQSLDRRFVQAAILLALALAVHPLMAAFGAVLTALLAWKGRGEGSPAVQAGSLAAIPPDAPDTPLWEVVRRTRRHHYVLQWTWYEWVGIVAPIGLLVVFSAFRPPGVLSSFAHLSRRTALFGTLFTLSALVLNFNGGLGRLGPLQPMRSLHLVYVVLFVLGGGLMGKAVLQRKAWRWFLFFLPLCLVMFLSQRSVFGGGDHVVFPWTSPSNPWVQAFEWVRLNTPPDAVFALNPRYMKLPGQDFHGFRALAERSALADAVKDPGVVAESFVAESIRTQDAAPIPALAVEWRRQTAALENWDTFEREDFLLLKEGFGVSWVVLEGGDPKGLDCRYRNAAVSVCRIPDP